jgi:FkbM family methyltransferase
MLETLLKEKYQIEAEMQANTKDDAARERYFDLLNQITRSHFGAFFAVFPEITTPLLLRGGSSDVWNMEQVFLRRQYAIKIYEPKRILDLGAYVGYTAVFFANRFPNAQIISVEPPGSNFDTLLANTAAYPNVRCLAAAVWHERTEIIVADWFYGDWGTAFKPNSDEATDKPAPAYTITDILEMYGWDEVDFIKCSSHAGRVDVLLRPRPAWLDKTLTVITRPGSGGWNAGDMEQVKAVLPEEEFERKICGPLVVFSRRVSETPGSNMSRKVLHLVTAGPQRAPFTLLNVNEELSFYRFGYAGIQLTPNPPNASVASFTTEVMLTGHSRFRVQLKTGDGSLDLIKVVVQIRNAETGAIALKAERIIRTSTDFDWDLGFDSACGLHSVMLSTEMIGADNRDGEHRPPCHFVDPRFL